MSAFVPKKLSVVLLSCAWIVALALVFLLNHALAGPRLGRVYDFLLSFRSPPPVSHQILLIDTEEVAEPGDVFRVLMTLIEMGAADLLVEVPVLGTRAGTAETGAEFAQRIDGEFYLLTRNVRSLFDAIRMGLLGPGEAPDYVESIVELAERGRDRLNAAAMRRQEEGAIRMERAAEVFGRAIMAADLRSRPGAVPDGDIPRFSGAEPDRDGRLRRVAPFVPADGRAGTAAGGGTGGRFPAGNLATGGAAADAVTAATVVGVSREAPLFAEHIVFRALRGRWTESAVEYAGSGPAVLVNRFDHPGGQTEFRFPLDRGGNIVFENPAGAGARTAAFERGDFRRISLDVFREYERADRTLARLLQNAWNMELYAEVRPERIPLILLEHAEYLKERLLESPGAENRALWLAARNDYVRSLEEFLYGPSEMVLVNGYETTVSRMTEEGADGRETTAVRHRRDTVIRTFVAMREAHRDFLRLREYLAGTVEAAFCIMAPPSPGGGGVPNSSALLANALLTGRSITPGRNLSVLLWSIVAAVAALALVYLYGSRAILLAGIAVGGLCFAAFGIAFIVSGYWIDPVIPTAAVLGGTLFLSVSRFCVGHFALLRFYRNTRAKERWLDFHFGNPSAAGKPAEKRAGP